MKFWARLFIFIALICFFNQTAKADLVGQYFQTPPTFNNGQFAPLALDPNGKLILSPSTNSGYISSSLSAPSSVLTRPANGNAYSGSTGTPQLIASSSTSTSVVVPSFTIVNKGGEAVIPSIVLNTNVTSGWGGVVLLINLWSAAPTYPVGDGGTYAITTGSANWRAQYSCTLVQFGDGATCLGNSSATTSPPISPNNGSLIYWDIEIESGATPISGQTFTLIPGIFN